MDAFLDILSQLGSGFLNTLLLFFITLLFALPLGLLISLLSISKIRVVRHLVRGFIWIIRGTPLMLQILLISLLPSFCLNIMNKDLARMFNISVSDLLFIFVAIAFIINYSCYFSEIYRAGIESVEKTQIEACEVLYINKRRAFTKVIFPQAIQRIIPPMGNEIITLTKDTALAQILGVVELLSATNHAVNQYVILTPLLYAAIFYLLFNGLLSILFSKIEKKLKH